VTTLTRCLTILTVAAALFTGCVGAGSVAVAATRPSPTPAEQARVFERLMTQEDVPRSLAVDAGIEYTMKGHGGQRQALCNKNGREIEGRDTDLLYQVEMGETNLIADPVAIEQKVWPYQSAQAALREWRYLERQVRQCTGRSQSSGETGGVTTQYLSNGRTGRESNGRTGIWIWIDARGSDIDSESQGAGYYVLHLAGDTIQSVEYDYVDAKGLSAPVRASVNQLAWRLAERWSTTS
jgi:hypothetical protein